MFNYKLIAALRTLYGLFLMFIGFINMIMVEPDPNGTSLSIEFEQAVIDTGYILKITGTVALLSGLALIVRKFIPFALLLFFPVLVNFLSFKLFLSPTSVFVPLIMLVIHGYLLVAYKEHFLFLFVMKTDLKPTND